MGKFFSAYGTPLMAVTYFKYLGRILSSSDDDGLAAEQNLRQARGKLWQIVNILGIEGVDWRTLGIFYVSVVKAVLFGGPRYG